MRASVLTLSAVVALAAAGCGKSPGAPAPAGGAQPSPTAKAPQAEPSATAQPKAGAKETSATGAPAIGAQAQGAAEGNAQAKAASPKAAGGPAAGDRAKMGEAFVEIYCAQQAGEADKLLAIYKRYGFQDPKGWTKAWTEAAKDEAWIARLTERAVAKCPPKR